MVSPNPNDAGLWIHQQAWFYLGEFDEDTSFTYEMNKEKNGVYAFVIDGCFIIDQHPLESRDALGISETDSFEIDAKKGSKILTIEVPM